MDYPELEKLAEHCEERSACNDFLEWLGSQNIFLVKALPDGRETTVIGRSYDQLVLDFLEIDQDALESERRDILDRIREANGY